MPWMTAIGVGASLIGGIGGKSKAGERAAKDAAARAQFSQDQARRQSMEALDPYLDTGRGASRKLADLLGVADPEGYARRPELQDFEDILRDKHFKKYGVDYQRNSNVAGQTVKAKRMYEKALQEWEAGKEKYMSENPNSGGSGDLLKTFTNEDFVEDPGHQFGLAEGEKGIERYLSKMGSLNSGAALKSIARYNNDYASTKFGEAFNRDAATKARTFSFLSGSAGQGLQAAGSMVGANTNAANNNSNIQQNLGTNLSNMYQTQADNESNMWQSAIGNGIYAYERNKPVTGAKLPDGGYGSSSQASKPWYLS